MDLVFTTLNSPQFWAGTVSGFLLAVMALGLIFALMDITDAKLDRLERAQNDVGIDQLAGNMARDRLQAYRTIVPTRNDRRPWPGTADQDARATAPRSRRAELRSGPR